MLSASEASAFRFGGKADSSAEFILSLTKGLRMTSSETGAGNPTIFEGEYEAHEIGHCAFETFVFFAPPW
jgi:hypothetical protein